MVVKLFNTCHNNCFIFFYQHIDLIKESLISTWKTKPKRFNTQLYMEVHVFLYPYKL